MSLNVPLDAAVATSLCFVRVVGLLMVAPIFGHGLLSLRVRSALAMALALALAPAWSSAAGELQVGPASVASELLVGILLGFVAAVVFAAFGLMSELASIQGGLGAASVLDPSSQASSLVLSQLVQFFGLLVFLAIDGHHQLLRTLAESFARIPPGSPPPLASLIEVAALLSFVFETGLRLAAPVTVAMLASNVVVGILGRSIPQLNLMSVQLPAQIGIVLLLLGVGATHFVEAGAALLRDGLDAAADAALGATRG